jgi:tRNA A37 methylthiotransferase MiaB
LQTTICLVQIGEVGWQRRISRQFQLIGGELRSKPIVSTAAEASLAYLPHAAGLLQGYASRYAIDGGSFTFLPPLFQRLPIAEAVEYLSPADVVGFSTYVWNIRYSLAVARELKRSRPDVLVVMGGPQIPDQAEAFLRAHPFVDVVCHGEGERTFAEILDRREERSWEGVGSTSFLTASGRFVANERRPRLRELDEIPSPMLDGAYDQLICARPTQLWLATWETNRGCPFSCAFCDWGSATASKVSRYSEERLYREVDWMVDNRIQYLFICDANFGMLARDVEIAQYLADAYSRRDLSMSISIQNTKNRTDRSEQIQRVFKRSRVVSFGAGVSLQSLDRAALQAIKRDNISLEAFESLQRHYAQEGLDTYTDLIIGLPGETYSSFVSGVERVIRNGQLNRIAFYECSVLPNAPMAQPDYRRTFGIETVPTQIVSAHEPLDRTDGQEPEFIDIVVSTASMNRADWVRARVFAYFVDLLFYDRVLHVPLVLLSAGWGLGLRRVFEEFMAANPTEFPVTAATSRAFRDHAWSISAGRPQYIPSAEWLNLWWPADQHALITLAHGDALGAFYAEARVILTRIAQEAAAGIPPVLVEDAVRLNHAMLALPFQLADEVVETTYPVADDYHAILGGQQPQRQRRATAYRVDRSGTIWLSWADWCADLVLRVNLRRRYLYPVGPDCDNPDCDNPDCDNPDCDNPDCDNPDWDSAGSPRRVASRVGLA